MTDNTANIARQPQGIPVGGQFAPVSHAESDVALAPQEEQQPSPPAPTVGEAALRVMRAGAELARATDAFDAACLDSAVVSIQSIFPGAKELHVKIHPTSGKTVPTFVRTADDTFLGARFDKSGNADWATRRVNGADPASITEALDCISEFSDVWRDDPRCEYEPLIGGTIIHLDGSYHQERQGAPL